jgi:hypothetical protein
MSLLTDLLDFNAAKRNQKRQNEIARRTTALDAAEFDTRMGYARDSFGRMDDLSRRQFTDNARLEDETFGFMLGNRRGGFDEQQGLARGAFDGQMDLLGGLMTAQRGARLEAQGLREAENARQAGFQGGVDDLARALPAQIGFNAQTAGAADALARRVAFTDANTTQTRAPTYGDNDSVLQRAFRAENARGMGEARTDAVAAAGLDARGDAFEGANRDLIGFATAVGQAGRQAANSRAALPAEMEGVRVGRDMAGERFGAETDLLNRFTDARGGAMSDFRVGEAGARGEFADRTGGVLNDFYGRTMGGENSYIDRMMGSSGTYTNKVTNLGNFKMQNTSTFNPWSTVLKGLEDAAAKAMSAGAGGG